MLDDVLNPTCAARTYRGGLACCQHGTVLLDQEQARATAAWPRDTIRLKFRLYFETYESQVHLWQHSLLPRATGILLLYLVN